MTCYRESPIIETSTAAAAAATCLYAFLCLSFSIIIPVVKSLLGPPIFVYADLTVCCKFPALSSKTPCSYIHYSEAHRELESKDAFSVPSCWTFHQFTFQCFYIGEMLKHEIWESWGKTLVHFRISLGKLCKRYTKSLIQHQHFCSL